MVVQVVVGEKGRGVHSADGIIRVVVNVRVANEGGGTMWAVSSLQMRGPGPCVCASTTTMTLWMTWRERVQWASSLRTI